MLYLSNSNLISSNARLVKVCSRLSVAPDELTIVYCTHRVISDKFVQLLSLIPILILLLNLRSSVHGFTRISSRMRTTVL